MQEGQKGAKVIIQNDTAPFVFPRKGGWGAMWGVHTVTLSLYSVFLLLLCLVAALHVLLVNHDSFNQKYF